MRPSVVLARPGSTTAAPKPLTVGRPIHCCYRRRSSSSFNECFGRAAQALQGTPGRGFRGFHPPNPRRGFPGIPPRNSPPRPLPSCPRRPNLLSQSTARKDVSESANIKDLRLLEPARGHRYRCYVGACCITHLCLSTEEEESGLSSISNCTPGLDPAGAVAVSALFETLRRPNQLCVLRKEKYSDLWRARQSSRQQHR